MLINSVSGPRTTMIQAQRNAAQQARSRTALMQHTRAEAARLLKRAEEAGWTSRVGREAPVDVAQRARAAPEYATKSSVSRTAPNAAPRDAAHQAPSRGARLQHTREEAARTARTTTSAAPRDPELQTRLRTARLQRRAAEGARTARNAARQTRLRTALTQHVTVEAALTDRTTTSAAQRDAVHQALFQTARTQHTTARMAVFQEQFGNRVPHQPYRTRPSSPHPVSEHLRSDPRPGSALGEVGRLGQGPEGRSSSF